MYLEAYVTGIHLHAWSGNIFPLLCSSSGPQLERGERFAGQDVCSGLLTHWAPGTCSSPKGRTWDLVSVKQMKSLHHSEKGTSMASYTVTWESVILRFSWFTHTILAKTWKTGYLIQFVNILCCKIIEWYKKGSLEVIWSNTLLKVNSRSYLDFHFTVWVSGKQFYYASKISKTPKHPLKWRLLICHK